MQRQIAIRSRDFFSRLRRLRQIRPNLGQQIRPAEIKLVAQLEHLSLRVVRHQRQHETASSGFPEKSCPTSLDITTIPAAFAAASTCPANTACVPIAICLVLILFSVVSPFYGLEGDESPD